MNKMKKNGFGINVPRENTGLKRFFQIPPFSVLNTACGWWQDRKRLWISFGLKGEIGRGESLLFRKADDFFGEKCKKRGATSIFDPVLCEVLYRWFCIKGGTIIDPFAGGAVRGIVASYLGYKYWGCDISKKQISANIEQANEILQSNQPEWICGDSLITIRRFSPEADFLFSCPPYGNLEVYSDNPKDISNKTYEEFIETYNKIILRSCNKLRNDRFACFVVANYRDKKGFYHDLVGDTIRAFEKGGCLFYNEGILVVPNTTLPIRVTRQFQTSRKLGKNHQNILIFFKGDPKNIKGIFGELSNQEC